MAGLFNSNPKRKPALGSVWLLVVTLAASAIAGCASLPNASKPAQIDSHQSRSGWWQSYGDSQLDHLMGLALNHSPDLKIVKGRLRSAMAQEMRAKAHEFPNLNLAGQDQSLSSQGGTSAGSASTRFDSLGLLTLNLGYEFDVWGKNRALISQAAFSHRAAQADVSAAELALTTAIASGYVDLQRAYDGKDLVETRLSIEVDALQIAQDKFNQGLINRIELDQAKSNVSASKDNVILIEDIIQVAKNRLATLCAQDLAFGNNLARPHLKSIGLMTMPAKIDLDLIGRRPDVQAARWRAEASAQGVKATKAAFYPNINLSVMSAALAVKGVSASGHGFDNHQDFAGFGPALSLPIFDAGRLKANLLSSQSDQESAIATYDRTVALATEDSANALALRANLALRVQEADQGVQTAREALSLMRQRQKAGISDRNALLMVQRGWVEKENLLSDLSTRAILADIAVIRALGGSYSEPQPSNPPLN